MSSINSLQSTIQDLKEIVQRNNGANDEASNVVRCIEQIVNDIERKTRKPSVNVVVAHAVQGLPVV